MGPVEAVRATGAGPLKVFIFAIWPQVKPAWLGFIIYNWDARLRASTILGFVGAGGIGLHLRLQISQLEYHAAMGIITLVIILVIISEAISHFLRERLR
jgi:phosphonate transport system permease protein